jgi:hypothetical protein
MAITTTPGYIFTADEKVTPDKLNALVDNAFVTNLTAAEIVSPPNKELTYGGAVPALEIGRIHYDTTPGFEGLKYAFATASNASFARWLYRTPHFDGVFWADSGASVGAPQFLAGHVRPLCWKAFDGHLFPRIQPALPSSAPTVCDSMQIVIPLESVGASNPVVCAILGLVPGKFLNPPLTGGIVYASSYTPTGFDAVTDTVPVNRSVIYGTSFSGNSPGVTLSSWILTGPLFQDAKL